MSDEIQLAIGCNMVALGVLIGFGLILGGTRGDALWGAWIGFSLGLFLTFWGWVIFVAAHFIGKYW